MYNFTAPLTVNGNVNLYTALKAAGYLGDPQVSFLHVLNISAVTTANLHFTQDGANAPATGTDGLPLLAGGASYPTGAITIETTVDLATTWLFTGASIPVKVAVIGG